MANLSSLLKGNPGAGDARADDGSRKKRRMTRRGLLLAITGAAIVSGVVINITSNPAARSLRSGDALESHNRQLRSVALKKVRKKIRKIIKQESDATPTTPQARFSYGVSYNKENCVEPEEVEYIAWTLRDLYEKHGIRAFPRNGFLLGIVRHGGFLPNEDTPDADIGIMFEDVEPLRQYLHAWPWVKVGKFVLSLRETEDDWVNWKGRNPMTKEIYPFFGVRIKRGQFSIRAQSVYPYGEPGTTFYPRLNRADYNHESHTEEMIRYNKEGANYRLLDSGHLLNEKNNRDGKQIGTVFQSTFECMTLKQFYFTMIYVPCDYAETLDAFYGRNWNHVESRANGGKGSYPALKLSKGEDTQMLHGGPKPLCA